MPSILATYRIYMNSENRKELIDVGITRMMQYISLHVFDLSHRSNLCESERADRCRDPSDDAVY